MRKILSLLLTLMLFSYYSLAANASITSTTPAANSNNKQEEPKQEIVDCSKSTDDMCKAIEINKEAQPLKSELSSDFKAYNYSLVNKYSKNIEVENVYNFITPGSAVTKIKSERLRFPGVILLVPGLAVVAVGAVFAPLAVSPSLRDTRLNGNELKAAYFIGIPAATTGMVILEALLAPIIVPAAVGATAWYTVGAPYYYFKDKKSDKDARYEAIRHLDKFPPQIIKPDSSLAFLVLLPKGNNSAVTLRYKDLDTGKEYIIAK